MAKERSEKKENLSAASGEERKEIINIISKLTKISKDVIAKSSGTHFTESGIDSFALVEIIFEIENKFNVSIPQDSLISVKSVDDLVGLVAKLQKNR